MRHQPNINDIRKLLITFFSLLTQIESVFPTDISVIMPVGKEYCFIWLTQCLCACVLNCFSHVRLLVILWTVVCQAPLSRELCRQEYWSGLLYSPLGVT